MAKITSALVLLSLLALGLDASPAQAQLARTWVSSLGNDANDCNRLTPCRTFQAAHDKTFDQGEITVLDPGGYGAVTITKSISIVNDGVGEAGILVSGGVTGITINGGPATYVNLRGITVQGIGFGGGTGLRFTGGFSLTMTNCVVRNHTQDGVDFVPGMASRLAMSNTLVADNGGNGIVIRPTGTDKSVSAVLNHVEAYQNSGAGVVADGSSSTPTNLIPAIIFVTVTASVSANNGGSGFVAGSPANHSAVEMHLTGSVSARNSHFGIEITAPQSLLVWLAQSTVVGNVNGVATGGTVFSYGDNYTAGEPIFNAAPVSRF